MANVNWWAKNASFQPYRAGKQLTEEDLNILTANSLISRGPLVFILMLMVIVGIVVNTIVTVVFLKRFPASALRSYILTMSVSDLVATGVAIPLHIYTLLNAYNFSGEYLCRVYFVLCSLSTNCSSFVVILLAKVRYRRICHPVYNELDRIRSYYQVGLAVFLAVLVTAPFVPLYGMRHVPITQSANLEARMCWVDDEHTGTLYPKVYDLVLGLTFVAGILIVCNSYGMIGLNIYHLTKDVSEEIQCRLANPPPPSNQPDIYAEDEPVEPKVKPMFLVIPDELPPSSIGFAARLHAPKEGYTENTIQPDRSEAVKKLSRIKKISTAIQNMFTPESPEPPSSSDSSFVSGRANTTVVAKTMISTKGSVDIAKPLLKGPVSKSPRLKKISLVSAYVMDSASATSSKTSLPVKGTVPLAQPSQNKNGNPDATTLSSLGTALETTDKSFPAEHSKNNLLPSRESPAPADSPTTPSPKVLHESAKPLDAATIPSIIVPTPETLMVTAHSTAVSRETSDKSRDSEQIKTPALVKEKAGVEISPVVTPPQRYYTVLRTRSEELASLEQMHQLRSRSNTMLITLVILYVVTWLPNLLSRVISERPANLCPGFDECWLNGPAYLICSVYLSSTINAFVYCFGSVHFRKQVTLFFKPCQDRLCRQRRKKKITRVVRRRKKTEQRFRQEAQEVDKQSKTDVHRKRTPAPSAMEYDGAENTVDGGTSQNAIGQVNIGQDGVGRGGDRGGGRVGKESTIGTRL